MLTNAELQQIRDYLLLYGKKDSQLALEDNFTSSPDDYLAIVRNGRNVRVTTEDFENSFLNNFLNNEGYVQAIDDIYTAIDTTEGAVDAATEVAEHPTYIGSDYYVYEWDTKDKQYVKTDIYTKGSKGDTGDTGDINYPTFEVNSLLHLLVTEGNNKFNLTDGHFIVQF